MSSRRSIPWSCAARSTWASRSGRSSARRAAIGPASPAASGRNAYPTGSRPDDDPRARAGEERDLLGPGVAEHLLLEREHRVDVGVLDVGAGARLGATRPPGDVHRGVLRPDAEAQVERDRGRVERRDDRPVLAPADRERVLEERAAGAGDPGVGPHEELRELDHRPAQGRPRVAHPGAVAVLGEPPRARRLGQVTEQRLVLRPRGVRVAGARVVAEPPQQVVQRRAEDPEAGPRVRGPRGAEGQVGAHVAAHPPRPAGPAPGADEARRREAAGPPAPATARCRRGAGRG